VTDQAEPRRKYQSRLRQQQAADTRGAIIAAARELFVANGWQGTTIAAVARRAGVSPESVYAVFGGKSALLLGVVQTAVRRGDPATPLVEQAGPRAVAAAGDQAEILRLFAGDIAQVLAAVADIVAVMRVAAQADPEVAKVYESIHAGRRENLALVARALAAKGPLRDGMSEAAALAQIWRLASPELFLMLTGIEGLTGAQYAAWLEHTLGQLLLVP
jgi:AcrR family transcriptional regulator